MSISVYQDKLFLMNTEKSSYILMINNSGLVTNIYWGNKIERIEDFADSYVESFIDVLTAQNTPQRMMEECSSFGGLRFKETSMKVRYADGVRDFRYQVKEYQIEGNHLKIVLEDIYYSLRVTLHYKVFEQENIIEKWREVENFGTEAIVLERFYSGEYGIEGTGYESLNYTGHWGSEFQQISEPVTVGKKVYESLYGYTSHGSSPIFVIHKDASETTGDVYYGALQYSGNFKSVVEAVSYGYLNVLIGISDTDFEWVLKEGEKFIAPSVFSGYSNTGFTGMTHTLTTFSRNHIMPKHWANKPQPVLYNSWYSTFFDVFSDDQIKLAEKAANIGVELFVVDDGWFEGRNDDKAGLGDWFVDKKKFPEGLTPLINRVNELGMDFGIWIEPEMVNPKSKLFEKHPDWIYKYETREVLMGRNQYMLDLANPEVVDYLIQVFDDLLTENNIVYIKWDKNRYASEMASSSVDPSEFKSIWFKHVQGFYQIISTLREKHPTVEFESCAGGGGRIDFGAMTYFDEFWTSDNTDPLDRLYMQESYSLMYPIKYMRAWYTKDYGMNDRLLPIEFSMRASMCGALGIGTDLNNTEEKELQILREQIAEYKEIRDVVQFGHVYRLKTLREDDLFAVQYVKDVESVLFVFLDHSRNGNKSYRVKLRGLEETAIYKVLIAGEEIIKSGTYLMNMGLHMKLSGSFDSLLIKLFKM